MAEILKDDKCCNVNFIMFKNSFKGFFKRILASINSHLKTVSRNKRFTPKIQLNELGPKI